MSDITDYLRQFTNRKKRKITIIGIEVKCVKIYQVGKYFNYNLYCKLRYGKEKNTA